MIKKIIRVLKNPKMLLMYLASGACGWIRLPMSDEAYIRLKYKLALGKDLNLDNPRTYNEKLQWLKLNDRKQEYINMVDKYEAKKYVAERIGDQYIIPTLGVWDRFDDIDFESLPNQFVLKCTHDSGGLVVVKDKSKLNIKEAKKTINKCLNNNFFYLGREWQYKNIKPRIIAEKYMVDSTKDELLDYKFFCFNGEPKAMFIATDRLNEEEETKFDFFDMDFKHLPFVNGHPNSKKNIICPQCFEEMKELAKVLSKDIAHIRVDFYEVDNKIYFGELTFHHWSGFVPFEPEAWDRIFGDWIDLPKGE